MIRPSRPRTIPHPTDPALALVPLNRGYFAVISAVDAAEVGRFHWHVRIVDNQTPYASRAARRKDGGTTSVSLHRFIGDLMGLSLSALVDHENGNGLDCRRSNLRDATPAQNARNARLRRDNPTGVKGVTPHQSRPGSPIRFQARIMVNRKAIYVGAFATVAEAELAIAEARAHLHGEFANHGSVH